MWIKVHNIRNAFTVLECLNFAIFDHKIDFDFFFEKVKSIKPPEGFELMTYKFIINYLTHCATQLGNNFGKEKHIILCLK